MLLFKLVEANNVSTAWVVTVWFFIWVIFLVLLFISWKIVAITSYFGTVTGSFISIIWVYVHRIIQNSLSIDVTIVILYFRFSYWSYTITCLEIKSFWGISVPYKSMEPINSLSSYRELSPLAAFYHLAGGNY